MVNQELLMEVKVRVQAMVNQQLLIEDSFATLTLIPTLNLTLTLILSWSSSL